MIAPAAQQTLIPSAACFHIGDGDERLRTHPINISTADWTPDVCLRVSCRGSHAGGGRKAALPSVSELRAPFQQTAHVGRSGEPQRRTVRRLPRRPHPGLAPHAGGCGDLKAQHITGTIIACRSTSSSSPPLISARRCSRLAAAFE